jgi:hypothetical protein
MQSLQALAATLALFAAAAGLLAISRANRRRKASAISHAVLAVLLFGLAAALWPIGAGLSRYERWREGQPVAELHFESLSPDRHRITLTHLPGGRMQVFDLEGQAWRLDARTLTWRGWAQTAGFAPRYQLDRLTGLAAVTTPAGSAPLRTFELGDPVTRRFWERLRARGYWKRVVEARQVYGPNTAITDGSRFRVTLTAHGLSAAPVDVQSRGRPGNGR